MHTAWPLPFAACLVLLAACAQSGAPVVDKPVTDWSMARTPPPPAGSPAGRAAAQPEGVKPAAPAAPDPDWRPDVYTVKRGDTLHSIALDHGQGYRDVAAWNGIADPNVIRVGQQLRVRPPPGWTDRAEAEEQVVTRSVAPPPAIEAKVLEAPAPPPLKTAPKALKLAYSERALAQMKGVPYKEPAPPAATVAAAPGPTAAASPAAATAPAGTSRPARPATQAPAAAAPRPPAGAAPTQAGEASRGWIWPAQGRLLHGFNTGANPKGIAIAGEAGQPVIASAGGRVVYSGSGLRGYGKLIIIKHNESYLSVYAHNRELLVKEGERVAQGQRIAEMGSTDADRVGLHFEIRRLGQPVDPLQYLPDPGA
jgi:lipoprotein NlpD